MLMKWLIAACILIGKPLGWAPETMVRLPNVTFGALSIAVIALLGRRLFGATAGLVAAAIAAFSPTFIGYHRVAKEDTLLGFFLMFVLLFCAEAKAAADDGRDRDRVRYEWLGAASLGAMFASKYFFFLAPIPVVLYLFMRTTNTSWRVPPTRWAALIGGAILVFAAINWTPFLPSSWAYGVDYMAEKQTIHGSLWFMGEIHNNLPSFWLKGTPPWFYAVFAAVKLAPLTVLAAALGLAIALVERKPSHLVVLAWLVVWFGVFSVSGAKWGRFFTSVAPAFFLLAAHAIIRAVAWIEKATATQLRARRESIAAALVPALAIAVVATEANAAIAHAPHYRLYVNAFGGGDENLHWFFPHCDYYDAGFREAVEFVAQHAEKNAELSTEIDWVAKYYAGVHGRDDLVHTLVRRGQVCTDPNRACYVITQAGRRYFLNREALATLASREPVHVVHLREHEAVKVYKIEPGVSLFPGTSGGAIAEER
jgi:4-amino-4-deoxy-L-arabinose transferase-like glycosyltransferase